MRPERAELVSSNDKNENDGEQMKPEKKPLAISEDAKAILGLLEKHSRILLNDLKAEADLSNKKWDKAIKELNKNQVAKVEKTEEGLFVEMV